VRARRHTTEVTQALTTLCEAAAIEGRNLMPLLLDCARAHASEGEIVEALQDVWGRYTEVPVF
jgi:methylmalonyl-CoA mutase N-terminal domain/subunit